MILIFSRPGMTENQNREIRVTVPRMISETPHNPQYKSVKLRVTNTGFEILRKDESFLKNLNATSYIEEQNQEEKVLMLSFKKRMYKTVLQNMFASSLKDIQTAGKIKQFAKQDDLKEILRNLAQVESKTTLMKKVRKSSISPVSPFLIELNGKEEEWENNWNRSDESIKKSLLREANSLAHSLSSLEVSQKYIKLVHVMDSNFQNVASILENQNHVINKLATLLRNFSPEYSQNFLTEKNSDDLIDLLEIETSRLIEESKQVKENLEIEQRKNTEITNHLDTLMKREKTTMEMLFATASKYKMVKEDIPIEISQIEALLEIVLNQVDILYTKKKLEDGLLLEKNYLIQKLNSAQNIMIEKENQAQRLEREISHLGKILGIDQAIVSRSNLNLEFLSLITGQVQILSEKAVESANLVNALESQVHEQEQSLQKICDIQKKTQSAFTDSLKKENKRLIWYLKDAEKLMNELQGQQSYCLAHTVEQYSGEKMFSLPLQEEMNIDSPVKSSLETLGQIVDGIVSTWKKTKSEIFQIHQEKLSLKGENEDLANQINLLKQNLNYYSRDNFKIQAIWNYLSTTMNKTVSQFLFLEPDTETKVSIDLKIKFILTPIFFQNKYHLVIFERKAQTLYGHIVEANIMAQSENDQIFNKACEMIRNQCIPEFSILQSKKFTSKSLDFSTKIHQNERIFKEREGLNLSAALLIENSENFMSETVNCLNKSSLSNKNEKFNGQDLEYHRFRLHYMTSQYLLCNNSDACKSNII